MYFANGRRAEQSRVSRSKLVLCASVPYRTHRRRNTGQGQRFSSSSSISTQSVTTGKKDPPGTSSSSSSSSPLLGSCHRGSKKEKGSGKPSTITNLRCRGAPSRGTESQNDNNHLYIIKTINSTREREARSRSCHKKARHQRLHRRPHRHQ